MACYPQTGSLDLFKLRAVCLTLVLQWYLTNVRCNWGAENKTATSVYLILSHLETKFQGLYPCFMG